MSSYIKYTGGLLGGGGGGGGGVTTVGTIDSEVTPSADGATILGTALILQTASPTVVGLVNTGAQTFAGTKTFANLTSTGTIIFNNLSGPGAATSYIGGDGAAHTLNQAAVAGLTTASSPTFAAVTATTFTGSIAPGGTSTQYITGTGSLATLNQAAVAGLTTASSPVFTGLTLSGMATAGVVHNTVTTGVLTSSLIVNADVSASAAIATSKLVAPGTSVQIVNGDFSVTSTLPVTRGGTGVTTSTGTGSTVLSTSPVLVTPALGTPTALVLTSATGLPLTTGVTGALPIANGGTGQTTAAAAYAAISAGTTAGGNATAGFVGEYVSANVPTAVTPTTSGAYLSVISISLTAGDWDVEGLLSFATGSSTNVGAGIAGAISLTTNTVDTKANGGNFMVTLTTAAFQNYVLPTGTRRINLTSTTNVFFTAAFFYATLGVATYTTDTLIRARRVR